MSEELTHLRQYILKNQVLVPAGLTALWQVVEHILTRPHCQVSVGGFFFFFFFSIAKSFPEFSKTLPNLSIVCMLSIKRHKNGSQVPPSVW